jgi:predicted permease
MVRTLLQDLRFGARLLLRDRSFTLATLLTLAICIGANAAIFSVVRSVLLRPLPVPNSDRILYVHNSYPNAGAPRASTGVTDYYDRLREMTVFSEQALYRRTGLTLGSEGGADRLSAVRATPSFYRIVGVTPIKGRVFREEEGEEGKDKSVILSYATWQQRFGANPNIVGQTIRLSGQPYEIVGVMPSAFRFLWNKTDLWIPASFSAKEKSDESRHSNNWEMIGLLKPGATLAQAQQELDAIVKRNDERFPQFHQILKDAGYGVFALGLQDEVVRDVRPVLYLLWGGVAFVLLIGCVNIANLVVIRSSARTRELATRHAIGASLPRLSRQLLTETVLLSAIGGLLGIALGWWALKSLTVLRLDQLPRGFEIGLDPASVAVMFALAIGVGLLIGLVPVIRLARLNVNTTLREEGRSGTSSRGTNLLRRVLATAQVAIAFTLLIGAGLLFASFRAVLKLDTGFDPHNVITASISLPLASYKDDAAVVAFTSRALAGVRALPGVESAGLTSQLPFSGDHSDSVVLAEGYVTQPGESLISPVQSYVTDGYFEAMRIPLVRGRYFDGRDTANSVRTIIVDERLAKKFWSGQDPLGRRMYLPQSANDVLKVGPDTKFMTVVGVVKEVQMEDPTAEIKRVGAYYIPHSQDPSNGNVLTVRTTTDSDAIMGQVRKVIASIDPELPLYSINTMETRLDDGFIGRRVPMLVAAAFAIVALFLAALGIYGVLAYGVAERRREIGIRMALGSSARQINALVLGDGARIVGVGLAIGLVLAYFVGRAMQAQLYEVQSTDPTVVGMVIGVLAVVALIATLVPARRASKVSPTVALTDS